MDYAANLALFLLDRTGSIFGTWAGHMPAAEQRALFGRFLGKGKLWINGEDETIEHHVKVCFGTDSDCTARVEWRDLHTAPAKAPEYTVTVRWADSGKVKKTRRTFAHQAQAKAFAAEECKWESTISAVCRALGINLRGDFAQFHAAA